MFRSQIGKKIRPWVSEDFLEPKVTTPPKIWGSAEIFTGLNVFLKFWSWRSKIFKNDPTLKVVKNHHFSTFVVFFLSFWANWAKLLIFAQFCLPEISTGLGYP